MDSAEKIYYNHAHTKTSPPSMNKASVIACMKEYAKQAIEDQKDQIYKDLVSPKSNGNFHTIGREYYRTINQKKLCKVIKNSKIELQ